MHEGIHLSKRRQVVEQSDALGHFGGVATILCAFAGPFGTHSVLGLPLRLIYWGLIIVATGMLGGLGIIMIDVWGVKLGTVDWAIALVLGSLLVVWWCSSAWHCWGQLARCPPS